MVFATYEAAEQQLEREAKIAAHYKENRSVAALASHFARDFLYKVSNPYRADLYILAENLAQAALMACNEYEITIVTGNLAKMENRS